MNAWLFIFGRTHELSLHELVALVQKPITRITSDVARVEDFQEEIVPEELINRSGGTVKIAREKGKIQTLTAEAILPFLEDQGEQLTFGVSLYGGVNNVNTELLRDVKELLAARGIRARYVVPHEGNTLSSVVVAKQHVRELIIVVGDQGLTVGETVAVQDFAGWNTRDYGRPFADPKAGMLPPKVARMAMNIAGESKVQSPKSKVLLDPFCGMGTILGEALIAGWKVIGSDQSEEVVSKAKKNLEWLFGLTGSRPVMKLFICDATHVSKHVAQASVDAIVTEPFMGSTDIQSKVHSTQYSVQEIKNVIKGLEKLYIGCLRDWYHVLKPGGNVVIALPEYAAGGRTFFVKNVIDRCENLGYTVTLGPLAYSRSQAVVRRKFYILRKK